MWMIAAVFSQTFPEIDLLRIMSLMSLTIATDDNYGR
jgi:hypothetical protein